MKVLVLADIDDLRWKGGAGAADAVLSCGDVADSVILGAAEAWGCAHIFAVKGNHDGAAPFPAPIVDVHLRVRALGGLTLGGFHGAWKYKPRGHFLYEQDDVARLLAGMPPVDVFLAHNSPRGIHDKDDLVHVGFDAFHDYIRRARPRLLLHGHHHRAVESLVEGTRILGVHGHTVVELGPGSAAPSPA